MEYDYARFHFTGYKSFVPLHVFICITSYFEHKNARIKTGNMTEHKIEVRGGLLRLEKDLITMRACLHTDPAQRPSFEEIVDRLNDVRKTGPDTVVPVKEGRAYTGKSTVFAYQSRDPVTIEAPMGKRVGRKGCFVVDMRNGDAHVFSPAVFQDIYEPVQGALANEYRRKGCVHAVHMKSAYAIKTDSPAVAGEAALHAVQIPKTEIL